MVERKRVPPGLDGVAITESSVAKSDVDGSLIYRGYGINELAVNASLEETAYLILIGRLPTRKELETFSQEMKSRARVDHRVFSLMSSLPEGSHPMDVIRTAFSSLASIDRQETVSDSELSIAAKMPVLAANCMRVPAGLRARQPRRDLGMAARLLNMITGKVASGLDLWVFERVMILYMEHDFNASSFTVRVAASTGADPYAAITAGLASLKGPLHGGANEAAMEMLLKLGEPDRVGEFVDAAFKERRKVTGFGHRVYKKFDPRARLCKEYLRRLVSDRGKEDRLYRLCDALETEMWQRKKIPPNLDFYAAPIFYLLGIPIPLYTPIFASSRVFGWVAHYNEQIAEGKLIRPDAIYVGPTGLRYEPIDKR